MKKKFLNTKNVVIGLVSLVLIGASATGVAVFLKDRGEAAAAEQEQVQNLPATGRGEDNNQTGENTTIPSENNTTGDNTQKPTEPSTTEGATPGETTRPGTTGTTTRSRTEEAVAGIEETVRIEERKVFEDLKLSWTTLAIPAITADMGIFKPVLGIEKTATAVVRANQEEQIPVTENNKPMVRAGDTVIYTIRVLNLGNYKATNVVVTDSLDVIFDGKIVPANKELVKIETLDAGKQATLKVGYVVKQEDINAVLETEQNETISKDIINIATATDGKTTVEDEDDMPVNPDVTINVNKNWQDNDNQDGKRPEKITVELYRNNENEPVETVTIDARSDWKHVFSNLPKYDEDKQEITYRVVEVTVPEYDTEYEISDNGVEIYNHHTPEKVSVEGSKTWDDADNQDGKRPSSIIVNLLADGEKVDSKTVTASDNWSWSFTGLDKYNSGTEIVYTISEDTVADYTTEVKGYNITNTHTPEKISISGSKTWDDNDNQDGKRPSNIKVILFADGTEVTSQTVTADNGWKWSFTDLDKYKKGKEIKYTVSEDAVTDYTTEVKGYNITNTHTPEKISISGSKTWDDNDNQDGKRPSNIKVILFADGTEVTSQTVTADNGWKWSFTDLDKYKKGKEIKYTVSEDAVTDYTTEVKGYNITNTHTPEKISISGSKTWDDADNQDGKRPGSIIVNLLADGEKVDSKTVTESDKWAWSFTNLDKYKAGKEIEYTVSEEPVEGYTTEVDGYNITNTHTLEKTTISGSKTWDDADNQDGKRPESITVRLFADGTEVTSKTVTAENEWNWSFTDLNKYAKGREIQYTITEDKVENYITNIEKTENGYVVTNSYTPETTSISVEKVWNDNDNQDGVRPASIKVKLYMKILDNNIAVANKEPLELNASTFWKAEFKDLPKYAKGIEIKYIVKEVNEQADATIKGTEYKVAYDDPIINENGKYIKITNRYTPKTTSVSVEKVWEDKNNQDGVRPDSINVQLYKTVGTTTTSVEKVKLTNSKLTHTWTELPQYEKGTEIKYTVRELDSNGNPLEDGKQINGKSGTKYTVKYTTDENGKQIITNTYKRVTTSVSGTKTWVDYDNKYNSRPESITINLLANGEKVDSKTITPQNGSWTYEFEGLPVYKNGQKITYTISEEEVSGYTSNVTGYNVTNTYTEAPKGTITMNWDTQSTTESPIPVDVVFVLDTSGSMTAGGSLRGTNMVTAVNNAIDEILRFNKNNRISVVGYSEYGILNVQYKNAEHSSVLLPLGRYTANDGQNYLKKSERIDKYDPKTGKPIYDYWVETNIQEYAKTRYFENGTFTQAGIQKGAEQLINSAGKTVKVDGKDVQRVPVIIIVSDGEPTVFSINYTSPLSESEKVLGTSQLANTSAVYGYYTILTANYFKQQVAKAYGTSAKVFTIAMDLTTHYGKTVLNPNDKNIGNCQNWIETDIRNQIEDKKISQKLYKYLNNFKQDIMVSCSVRVTEDYKPVNEKVKVVKNPYSNYSYADKAFADDGMNADDLKRAMIGSITETVSNKKTHNIDENDRKIGKVYLDKIDITKNFELKIAGGKTYTSYKDAENDKLVGFDGEKYYVDLTKLIGKTVTVNYRQK